uniref:Uncharacterized protein n=1 Tax=Rhizophora mucronata TaxID=61149 RepID=A0A2P2PKJ8_RHIMU
MYLASIINMHPIYGSHAHFSFFQMQCLCVFDLKIFN